jgi:hypothetical protein
MAKFSKDNQPKGNGRKLGSKNIRTTIPLDLQNEALAKLTEAVGNGAQWAVSLVIERSYSKLKPTATGTEEQLLEAQIELTRFKVKELESFEARLEALEANQ